jgi:hypothetical protein
MIEGLLMLRVVPLLLVKIMRGQHCMKTRQICILVLNGTLPSLAQRISTCHGPNPTGTPATHSTHAHGACSSHMNTQTSFGL